MMGVVRLPERYVPDLDLYHERARTRPCFVCGIVARDPDFSDHHIAYEDQQFAAVMLDMPDGEKASLAARIGRRMGR
jgi:hypothetical protein